MSVGRLLRLDGRARVALMGTLALFVALVATAFAIGGSGSSSSKTALLEPAGIPIASVPGGYGATADSGVTSSAPSLALRHGSVEQFSATGSGSATSGSSAGGGAAPTPQTAPDSPTATDASSSVEATKIVKTGELTVRVGKSQVQSVVGQLSTLATAQGGYVASSNTNTGGGEPSGEVVLRIPVDHFDDAINAAEKIGGGHVLSLTTSADDVTGHYVDLSAKLHALQQTRSTYLTILGRATTIGATLAVQERIQEVQEQIDQLTGQLKVLGNQTSYSTLTVDVTPDALVAAVPHHRHGLSKAWHTSWSRFGRGIDAIVGAIGPLVLAILILGVVAVVLAIGYRGVRKATT
ncbi:MAG TPA: DUF4349 domain-containing protein [Mycobacteriales bacterium]|jgi:hypothetical protein|nr:DUF4349 domain-containing protein [Mycobacteriales bacterium]